MHITRINLYFVFLCLLSFFFELLFLVLFQFDRSHFLAGEQTRVRDQLHLGYQEYIILTKMLHRFTKLIMNLVHFGVNAIFTLPHTPRPKQIHAQILEKPRVHQLVTAMVTHALSTKNVV